jgi:hypothetical protein
VSCFSLRSTYNLPDSGMQFMFAIFKRKKTAPTAPPTLYFKDSTAAFEYACKYMAQELSATSPLTPAHPDANLVIGFVHGKQSTRPPCRATSIVVAITMLVWQSKGDRFACRAAPSWWKRRPTSLERKWLRLVAGIWCLSMLHTTIRLFPPTIHTTISS